MYHNFTQCLLNECFFKKISLARSHPFILFCFAFLIFKKILNYSLHSVSFVSVSGGTIHITTILLTIFPCCTPHPRDCSVTANLYFSKNVNTSQICMSSLHRGHAHLSWTLLILVHVLPKQILHFSLEMCLSQDLACPI